MSRPASTAAVAEGGSGPVATASLPWSPVPDDSGEVEPQGLLPQLTAELTSLRTHVDTVDQDVAGLVGRLAALGTALSGVEATLGDRLAEYADTVVQLGRGLTTNLTTYREGNERTIAELRRALADSEELLRAVLTKADDLAIELASVRAELSSDGTDHSFDADELRDIVRDAVTPLDLRAAIGQVTGGIAALSDRLTNELAVAPSSTSVDAAMQAELLTAVEGMRADLGRLRRAGAEKPTAAADDARERALMAELEAMREEIAGLKRRIALRRTKLSEEEVEQVADAVARRVSQAFEVVPDDEPAPPPPKPATTRASRPATAAARSAKSTRRG